MYSIADLNVLPNINEVICRINTIKYILKNNIAWHLGKTKMTVYLPPYWNESTTVYVIKSFEKSLLLRMEIYYSNNIFHDEVGQNQRQ